MISRHPATLSHACQLHRSADMTRQRIDVCSSYCVSVVTPQRKKLKPSNAGCARVPESMSSCIRLVDLTSQAADERIQTGVAGHHAGQPLGIVERGCKILRITAERDKCLKRVA